MLSDTGVIARGVLFWCDCMLEVDIIDAILEFFSGIFVLLIWKFTFEVRQDENCFLLCLVERLCHTKWDLTGSTVPVSC